MFCASHSRLIRRRVSCSTSVHAIQTCRMWTAVQPNGWQPRSRCNGTNQHLYAVTKGVRGGGGGCVHKCSDLLLCNKSTATNPSVEADVVPMHNAWSPKSLHVGRYPFFYFLARNLGFSAGYYATFFKRKLYMSKPKIIITGSCGAKLHVTR
jgi:hypothetical protein